MAIFGEINYPNRYKTISISVVLLFAPSWDCSSSSSSSLSTSPLLFLKSEPPASSLMLVPSFSSNSLASPPTAAPPSPSNLYPGLHQPQTSTPPLASSSSLMPSTSVSSISLTCQRLLSALLQPLRPHPHVSRTSQLCNQPFYLYLKS